MNAPRTELINSYELIICWCDVNYCFVSLTSAVVFLRSVRYSAAVINSCSKLCVAHYPAHKCRDMRIRFIWNNSVSAVISGNPHLVNSGLNDGRHVCAIIVTPAMRHFHPTIAFTYRIIWRSHLLLPAAVPRWQRPVKLPQLPMQRVAARASRSQHLGGPRSEVIARRMNCGWQLLQAIIDASRIGSTAGRLMAVGLRSYPCNNYNFAVRSNASAPNFYRYNIYGICKKLRSRASGPWLGLLDHSIILTLCKSHQQLSGVCDISREKQSVLSLL